MTLKIKTRRSQIDTLIRILSYGRGHYPSVIYYLQGSGGCCQDLGRGSKFGLSMKSMLRAYITSSQAKISRSTSLLQRRLYVSNGEEKLAYTLLVLNCLTVPPLFIFFFLIKLKVSKQVFLNNNSGEGQGDPFSRLVLEVLKLVLNFI